MVRTKKLKLDVCPKATPGRADAAWGPRRRGWGERAGIYPEYLGPPAGRSLVQGRGHGGMGVVRWGWCPPSLWASEEGGEGGRF